MNAIHIVLQGKGGVGKSFAASMLAQYLMSKSDNVYCADADPVNHTFHDYSMLNAGVIHLLNKNDQIDSGKFDVLIETMLEHSGPSVVDTGSSTFIPLSAYLVENNVFGILQEAGKTVYIHTVLTGGQALDETIRGLHQMITNQTASVVVWENDYFGEVEKNGKKFVETPLYLKNTDRIKGIVKIHNRNPDTFGKDLQLLLANKMTFDESLTSDKFRTMARSRLNTIKKSIFDQLDSVEF